jgi:DNA polymerase delta subunit 4
VQSNMNSLANAQKRKAEERGKTSGTRLSGIPSHTDRGLVPGSVKELEELEQLEQRLRSEFDLETKYGPVVGLSRLGRWERAVRLGLEPPRWVRDTIVQHGTESDLNAHIFTSGKV